MNQAGTGNAGGAPPGAAKAPTGGGAGGTAPLPIPPGPVGNAEAEAAQRAAEVALSHRMMMSGAANAEMMMAMAGGGGVNSGNGSGGALLTHQYQGTQTIPYTLNPDGTPLLDHHYRPIPLQKILQTRPLKADVSTRPGPGNMKLTYMSGEVVTRTLNELFGFGGWSMEVREKNREQCEKDHKGRYHVHYTATVRITHVGTGSFREDVGANDSIDKSLGTAVANAMKGAVTDAMKRAARHFGEKMGNSLYDSKFKLAHAPITLKQALETYELDRNKATFFEKDRTRLPDSANASAAAAAAAAASTSASGTAMVKMESSVTTTAAATATAGSTAAVPPTRRVVTQAPPHQLQQQQQPKLPTETPRGPLYGKQPGTVGTGAGTAGGLGVVVGRTPGNGPLHGNTGASATGGGGGGAGVGYGGGGRPSIGAAQPQPQKSMPYTPHPHQVRAPAAASSAIATTAAAAAATAPPTAAGGYPSITPGPGTVAKMQQQQQNVASTATIGTTQQSQVQQQQQAKTQHGPPSARQNLQQSGLFSQYSSADGNGPPNAAALNDVTTTSNVVGASGTAKPQTQHEMARPGTSRGRSSIGAGGNGMGQSPFASQQQQVHHQSQLQSQHQQGLQSQGVKRQMGQDGGGDANKRPAVGAGATGGGASMTATNPYNV